MIRTREWFSYDPEDGMSFHATESEARDAADLVLDMERDNAGDEWAEHVTEICYGRIYGEVRQICSDTAPEGSEFAEIADYALRDVLPPADALTPEERATVEHLRDWARGDAVEGPGRMALLAIIDRLAPRGGR